MGGSSEESRTELSVCWNLRRGREGPLDWTFKVFLKILKQGLMHPRQPQTPYIAKADLELLSFVSISQVLGLQVCITVPSS